MPTTPLDQKINAEFPGKVVRKDLTARVRGNAVVPTYVLEYLLGQYCASDDETTIEAGVDSVKKVLGRHYVHREQAELVKSTIRDLGTFRVIDRLAVTLDDRRDTHVAAFTNLGLRDVPITDEWPKKFPKLLTGGVWCLVDVSYYHTDDKSSSNWAVERVKPIQMAGFDFDDFLASRSRFTTEEWMDVLLQSISFDPQHFSRRAKLLQLTRLVPFAESNFNLIELGPKGTGKSHVFSEFSPHGMLISGGEVTLPKLFVDNSTGKIGLVGYWDSVAFDEFAGTEKKVPQALVDVMKNYMANKNFSRGREMLGAEASMVFIGNTKRSVAYMLKHSNLFEQLPKAYYDTAFLDRIHHYIPGWEVSILRGEMFTESFGFIVDYLAEVFRHLRKTDYGNLYAEWFELDTTIATRDKRAITKCFGGMVKVIYPSGKCNKEEARELLEYAIEGRRRVKLQLMKMDETFREMPIRFAYRDRASNQIVDILTMEELDLGLAGMDVPTSAAEGVDAVPALTAAAFAKTAPAPADQLTASNMSYREGQRGVSYRRLFGKYLAGATEIHIQDPYIRLYHQVQNLAEFCQMVYRQLPKGDEVTVKLWTKEDEREGSGEAEKLLMQLESQLEGSGVSLDFTIEPADSGLHDRYIETDTGWKIVLGRGLDIFQRYNFKERFNLAITEQEMREVKDFEVTYVRVK